MPHKHTRRREVDGKGFNLAPSQVAKPLPAFEKSAKSWQSDKTDKKAPEKKPNAKRKRKRTLAGDYKEDDTPRAFARLMQLQAGQKLRSGLDDGETTRSKKKRKTEKDGNQSAGSEAAPKPSAAAEPLKITPGEKMSDFSARVNQALPMGGLSRKGKQAEGMKERQTKTEKRLQKMYAEWREEEARRKEKLEELQEQQEDEDEEKEAENGGQSIHLAESGKRARRKRMVGEIEDDEDPWAVLKSKRDAPKGLHDVVQAPPTMKVVPKEKFKVRNGAKVDVANVPGNAGSLKRREELGEARKEVIERYRAMMKGNGKA